MSILFVLLTFLLILTVMYFRRPEEAVNALQTVSVKKMNPPGPFMVKQGGFEIPQGYCFHPGHTWVVDEGRQNARVGIDAFAGNLFGTIDSIEVADLNRWVRQGPDVPSDSDPRPRLSRSCRRDFRQKRQCRREHSAGLHRPPRYVRDGSSSPEESRSRPA